MKEGLKGEGGLGQSCLCFPKVVGVGRGTENTTGTSIKLNAADDENKELTMHG